MFRYCTRNKQHYITSASVMVITNIVTIYLLVFLTNHYYVASEITSTVYKYRQYVENVYINNVAQGSPSEDIMASLSKEKYLTLCKLILRSIGKYRNERIYINVTAFYMKNPPFHVEKPVNIQTKLLLQDENIPQKMYPCYGRHTVLHTNYKKDDFYDKFFISAGSNIDSIIIYVHDSIFEEDSYKVSFYIRELKFVNLPDTKITKEEVQEEIRLPDYAHVISTPFDIESIYVKEQHLFTEDPLCGFQKEILANICKTVLRLINADDLNITLNWTALFIYPVKCVDKYLIFGHWPRFKNQKITRKMIPCYTRHQSAPSNSSLFDEFLTFFYISSGPRMNSLLLYGRDSDADDTYRLVTLIENIPVNRAVPLVIQSVFFEKESPDIMNYILIYYQLDLISQVNRDVSELSEEHSQSSSDIVEYLVNIKSLRQLKSYFKELRETGNFRKFKNLQEMKKFLEISIDQCPNQQQAAMLRKSLIKPLKELIAPSFRNREDSVIKLKDNTKIRSEKGKGRKSDARMKAPVVEPKGKKEESSSKKTGEESSVEKEKNTTQEAEKEKGDDSQKWKNPQTRASKKKKKFPKKKSK